MDMLLCPRDMRALCLFAERPTCHNRGSPDGRRASSTSRGARMYVKERSGDVRIRRTSQIFLRTCRPDHREQNDTPPLFPRVLTAPSPWVKSAQTGNAHLRIKPLRPRITCAPSGKSLCAKRHLRGKLHVAFRVPPPAIMCPCGRRALRKKSETLGLIRAHSPRAPVQKVRAPNFGRDICALLVENHARILPGMRGANMAKRKFWACIFRGKRDPACAPPSGSPRDKYADRRGSRVQNSGEPTSPFMHEARNSRVRKSRWARNDMCTEADMPDAESTKSPPASVHEMRKSRPSHAHKSPDPRVPISASSEIPVHENGDLKPRSENRWDFLRGCTKIGGIFRCAFWARKS